MHLLPIKKILLRKAQAGMTLIELLVAAAISVVALSGMVLMMSSTLGTGSHTIQMTRLTEEIRGGLQIMSRELRRANYHASFLSCYGAVGCRTDLGISGVVKDISITGNNINDCVWFWYDRPQSGAQVLVNAESVAAFRRVADGNGVGKLQMTTTRTVAPTCNAAHDDAQWITITDSDMVDILSLDVSDTNSFTEIFNGNGDTQSVERITLTISGRLVPDPAIPAFLRTQAAETKTLQHFVQVRNHTTSLAVAP